MSIKMEIPESSCSADVEYVPTTRNRVQTLLGSKTPRWVDRYPHGPFRRHLVEFQPKEVTVSNLLDEIASPGWKTAFVVCDRLPLPGILVESMEDALFFEEIPHDHRVWKVVALDVLSTWRLSFSPEFEGMSLVWHRETDIPEMPDPAQVRHAIKAADSLDAVAFFVDLVVAKFPERPEHLRKKTLLSGVREVFDTEPLGITESTFHRMKKARWKQIQQTAR